MSQTSQAQAPAKPKSEVKLAKAAIALGVGVVIALIPPPVGMTVPSMQYLGVFLGMVVGMIIGAAPMWAVSMSAAMACVTLGILPLNAVMAEFSGSTIWMLLAVVGFAGCLQASGIMKRIAFNILRFFPPNYTGQVLAMITACLVIGPIVPSSTAKQAMMSPLNGTIIAESGMKPHSKGAKGLWFIQWMVVFVGAPIFLTGSNLCLILLGFLPSDVAGHFTWMNWFISAIPWGAPMLLLTVLYVLFFLRPEEKSAMTKEMMNEQVTSLGPMSGDEKYCLIVLVITVLMWVFADTIKISTAATSWFALLAMYVRGLFGSRDLVAKLPWSLVMMFGPMMGVVGQMRAMGVTDWIASLLPTEMIQALIPNGFVFVIILMVFTFVARFAIDQMTMIPMSLAIFGPIAAMLGINQWVILFVMWNTAQTWILPHHGVMQMQTFSMMGGNLLEIGDVKSLTWVYTLISAAATLIAVPFWMGMGLM